MHFKCLVFSAISALVSCAGVPELEHLERLIAFADANRAASAPYKGTVKNCTQFNPTFMCFYYGKARFQEKLKTFYKGIVHSAYFDWMSEYGVYRGSYVNAYQANTTASNTEPENVAAAGPEFDQATGNCKEYCAYHTPTTYNGITFSVGLMPDCSSKFYHPDPFSSLTCVASHELIESATDPTIEAWKAADGSGAEVGDLCFNQCGKVKDDFGNTHIVQYEWSNAAAKDNSGKGCVITKQNKKVTTNSKAKKTK
ncbi:hypothetical protein BJ741DRAFT_694964 [Chytriomyces cf. hyalinus JEL632]|nr:hypothetical protein BJ741DRAFT_694964 [Chytriomyces cf. hyalinus JEL632]